MKAPSREADRPYWKNNLQAPRWDDLNLNFWKILHPSSVFVNLSSANSRSQTLSLESRLLKTKSTYTVAKFQSSNSPQIARVMAASCWFILRVCASGGYPSLLEWITESQTFFPSFPIRSYPFLSFSILSYPFQLVQLDCPTRLAGLRSVSKDSLTSQAEWHKGSLGIPLGSLWDPFGGGKIVSFL